MIDYNLIRVTVNLAAIRANYRLMAARGSELHPVIKADAYGHGLIPVARALMEEGAGTFCTGSVAESARLAAETGCTVISLLGPVVREEYGLILEYDLIPFIGRFEQLEELNLAAGKAGKRARVALKFDTGMGRLGFAPEQAVRVAERVKGLDHTRAVLAASHLAWADAPEGSEFLTLQRERFAGILAALRAEGLDVRGSLANSAGILAGPELLFDVQRPGISLYGGNPFYGTPWADRDPGLVPAMTAMAPILQVNELEAGTPVSYGCTHVTEAKTRVAVVAAGYADNYSRGLSSKGVVLIHGKRAKVLGRVCMQLIMADVSHIPEAAPGDVAFLLGGGDGGMTPDELAASWGTISYEVMCLLGQNPRTYVD